MSGGLQRPDPRKQRYNPGVKNIVAYCAFFAFLFVVTSILVEIPVMQMMISGTRKMYGITFFVTMISFFAVFSFMSSRSNVCWLSFVFVLVLVACPIFLLLQEPYHLFNYVKTKDDVLPFCRKGMAEPLPPVRNDSYVVFRPTDTGTGNRILGLVSSYALALATGRKLLIDWQLTGVFGAQFTDLFVSSELRDLKEVIGNQTLKDDEYDFLNLVYCRQCSVRLRHPSYAFITSNNLNKELKKKFVVVLSNVYFAPSLLANKHHRNSMCSLLTNESSLFAELFHRLLKLTPEMQKEVDNAVAQFDGKYPIGFQIRLKDRVGFPRSRTDSFFNCVQTLAARHNNSIVFIASETEELKQKAQDLFGSKLYRIEKQTEAYTKDGIKAALLDIMILSKCKELVLTPFSTFGAVAAGIGRTVPHFVTRDEGYCIKDLSYEPKFHYWHALSLDNIEGMSSSYMVNQDDSFM